MVRGNVITGDHWAHFGDGNSAQIIDSKEYYKENGLKYVKFMFIPSKLILRTYDIESKLDPNSGIAIMEYPSTEVLFLQNGTLRTRCWIFTDFINGMTNASNRTKDLNVAIDDSARLIKSMEAAKNRAYQELYKERAHQAQSIKSWTNLLKIMNQAKSKGGEDDSEDVYSE